MRKLCTAAGCRQVVECDSPDDKPRCPKHQHKKHMLEHQTDDNGRYIYHTSQWKRLRLQKLAQNPMCEHCEIEGRAVAAVMVDHVKEISDGGDAYDIGNLQSLCYRHHAIKTGRERKRRNNNT